MGTGHNLSHERCQAVFEALGYGLLLLTPDGRVEQANRAMAAILGRRPEELIGRIPRDVMPGLLHPPEACPFWQLRKSLRPESAQLQVGERWYQVTADPILDRKGKLTGAVVMMADTTEQMVLEEQLRRSQKMEAIGRLAGVLAHDFNNLLTMISGYCQMVRDGLPVGDRRRKDLEAILQATARAANLTRQLLAIGHRQPARTRRLDLNRLISRMERILRRVAGKRIHLSVRLGRPLGRIQADPAQIEQVIMNLVGNARDAMPKGGRLTITTAPEQVRERDLAMRPHLAPGRYVLLTVEDTGMGMDPETKRHLFEPFFTTKPRHQGVGLGLSTVYGIVKQSKGEIEVESEPGRGAAFRIYFPVAPASRARQRPGK